MCPRSVEILQHRLQQARVALQRALVEVEVDRRGRRREQVERRQHPGVAQGELRLPLAHLARALGGNAGRRGDSGRRGLLGRHRRGYGTQARRRPSDGRGHHVRRLVAGILVTGAAAEEQGTFLRIEAERPESRGQAEHQQQRHDADARARRDGPGRQTDQAQIDQGGGADADHTAGPRRQRRERPAPEQPQRNVAQQDGGDRLGQRARPRAGIDAAPQPQRHHHQRRQQQGRRQAEEAQDEVRAPRACPAQNVARRAAGGGVERRIVRMVAHQREGGEQRQRQDGERARHGTCPPPDSPGHGGPTPAALQSGSPWSLPPPLFRGPSRPTYSTCSYSANMRGKCIRNGERIGKNCSGTMRFGRYGHGQGVRVST